MSTTTTFYTTPILRDAVIDSATSNQADAIANLIDQNLDTTWTPTTTANQTIIIDTQSVVHASPLPSPIPAPSIGVAGVGIWLANNDTDFSVSSGSGMILQAGYSEDGITYTNITAVNFEPLGGNLFWFNFTEQNARYWRLIISGLASTLPEISQLFLLTTRALTARPEFTIKTPKRHFNNRVELKGGLQKVSSQRNNFIRIFDRAFTMVNSAGKDILESIYEDSQGSLLPLIYQEGTLVTDAYLVRLSQEETDINEVDFDYFKATVQMQQLPYIKDGDTF